MKNRPTADRHRTPRASSKKTTRPDAAHAPKTDKHGLRRLAVIGAGMAGIACARTLIQAGHDVTVFEREETPGGRMASERTPFGRFDSGAQYFTVRDPRFVQALQTAPTMCKPWSANAVRVLDPYGRTIEAALPNREAHWVALPGMDSLLAHWAAPLGKHLRCGSRVTQIEPDSMAAGSWQLRVDNDGSDDDDLAVHGGFDAVLLAVPPSSARRLLQDVAGAGPMTAALEPVRVAPCWTLMIAFPQAVQPGLAHIGPQWNAARSTHHRVAWLARESSKPGRDTIERWTLQASAAWSAEHLQDDAARVKAKLLRAFAEITGIHATPGYAQTRCWREARTDVPMGASHVWDGASGLGLAGDWCLGHRVEDAFVSGLELALDV